MSKSSASLPAPAKPLAAAFNARLNALLAGEQPASIAVAVSGGADSLALSLLLQEWAAARGVAVQALTVNHQLRPEAASEAEQVADWLANKAISHNILTVDVPNHGNQAQAARQARYQAMAAWCKAADVKYLCIGHHVLDQAETLLMRLGRGSGLTGLTAMSPRQSLYGLTMLRPLLEVMPDDLRAYLNEQNQHWLEDPSNQDTRKQRNALRTLWPQLIAAGITPQRLGQSVVRLQAADAALEQHLEVVEGLYHYHNGEVRIDCTLFAALPQEQQTRLLRRALVQVSGQAKPPRRDSLLKLHKCLGARRQTLHGCLVWQQGDHIRIAQE